MIAINSLGGNSLITPGHVHVLGILRGARENREGGVPSEPTGNPQLDMKQQRQQERYMFSCIVEKFDEKLFNDVLDMEGNKYYVILYFLGMLRKTNF